jgi:C_GCAxxG_C_C family probable redox protein
MGKALERSKEVRAIVTPHYNCAQGVLVAFADSMGVDEETAYKMGAQFGAGMKCGSVCGAITGGLMVLGLLGAGDEKSAEYMKIMRSHHENNIDCRDLLRSMAERGENKKEHCDGMVFESVRVIEKLMNLQ